MINSFVTNLAWDLTKILAFYNWKKTHYEHRNRNHRFKSYNFSDWLVYSAFEIHNPQRYTFKTKWKLLNSSIIEMVLWNHSKVFHLVTKPFQIIFWQKVLSWGINPRWNLFALAIHPLLKIISQEKSSKGIMQYLKVSKCTGVASCKLQRCCIPPISLIAVHNHDFSIPFAGIVTIIDSLYCCLQS